MSASKNHCSRFCGYPVTWRVVRHAAHYDNILFKHEFLDLKILSRPPICMHRSAVYVGHSHIVNRRSIACMWAGDSGMFPVRSVLEPKSS